MDETIWTALNMRILRALTVGEATLYHAVMHAKRSGSIDELRARALLLDLLMTHPEEQMAVWQALHTHRHTPA